MVSYARSASIRGVFGNEPDRNLTANYMIVTTATCGVCCADVRHSGIWTVTAVAPWDDCNRRSSSRADDRICARDGLKTSKYPRALTAGCRPILRSHRLWMSLPYTTGALGRPAAAAIVFWCHIRRVFGVADRRTTPLIVGGRVLQSCWIVVGGRWMSVS